MAEGDDYVGSMATLIDSEPSEMTQPAADSKMIGAIAGVHLLLAVAAASAGSSNIGGGASLTWWTGAPFFVPLALTPIIAHTARTRRPWASLAIAAAGALAGAILTIMSDDAWVWVTGVTVSRTATFVAAAVLLITAWRSSPSVTALLAGVFVLSDTLARAIVDEYFARVFASDAAIDGRFAGLEYLAVGSVMAASALLLLLRPTEDHPHHEHGLSTVDRLVAVLAIGGAAFALTHRNVGDGTTMVVIGLVLVGAGLVIARIARVNRWSDTTTFHLDARILLLCGAAIASMALIGLVDLAPRPPGIGGLESGWRRTLDVLAIALIVPVVMLASRFPRPVLSAGALLGAAYGAVRFLDVTGDQPLDQRWLLTGRLMSDLTLALLLGGTVAIALRRADHVSVEVGVIVFLAGAWLMRGAAAELGMQYTGDAWREGDTSPFRNVALVGSVGLAALAIWWAGTSSPGERPSTDDTLLDP